MAQPNAGQPKLVDMKVVYDETPEQMVRGVVPLLEAGANIIGACCGSTPDHIRAFRSAMDQLPGRAGEPAGTFTIGEHEALRRQPGALSRSCRAKTDDKSGIGVHYVDAYMKPMNVTARGRHGREVQAPRPQDRAHRRQPRRARA